MSDYHHAIISRKIGKWLEVEWPSELPPNLKGFCFNLNGWSNREQGYYNVDVELIGADRFSETDADWPCHEIWHLGNPRASLALPEACSTGRWEDVLADVESALMQLLEGGSKIALELKSGNGVAVGFVDGDLKVLHQGIR